jgi:acetyl-CoA C-acetyltransferase
MAEPVSRKAGVALDPRTPVLVGVGAVSQREADPARAEEPLALMVHALRRAAQDAGGPALLARADSIRAPRGFWSYPDPCRMLAERFGAAGARTEIAEIGVLQTALLGRAAADIAAGRADVVLVVGAEARHRMQRALAAGIDAPLTRQAAVTPDCVLRPHAPILSAREIRAGLALPVVQYALLENALRAAEGLSLEAHRRGIATLWAALARVAAGNPDAWSREPVSAEVIADPGRNPMLASPYGRLHCSQWSVDQAAGLVFCSVATARALGTPRERWIFPLAVADANHMLPYTERRLLHRCAGFARAAERAFGRAGFDLASVEHRELYSCFPAAVRVQLSELGVADQRPFSVTGGMPFAGGPLNHFVLQSLVRMAQLLRGAPGSRGLLTAVSGVIGKQGVSLWSSAPGAAPFAHDDVSEATAQATSAARFVDAPEGPARVATYTVVYQDGRPKRLVSIAEFEDGGRTLASSEDPALVESATRDELCGREVRIGPGTGGSAGLAF